MSAAGAKALHDMMTWRGVPGPDWHSGQVRGEGQPACVAHVAVRAATSVVEALSPTVADGTVASVGHGGKV